METENTHKVRALLERLTGLNVAAATERELHTITTFLTLTQLCKIEEHELHILVTYRG